MESKIIHGDCFEELKKLEDNSVDAIVTDPPYGLSFMGKKWDYDVPAVDVWKEAIRVLKPGGFLLSFAGTRTYHRMTVNIEDAGFEIRDMISWLYGTGFPKSLNIGKQIDKMEGVEHPKNTVVSENTSMSGANYTRIKMDIQSDLGKEWEGWGTALKPACEPIVVARKPLSEKNVALNVLKWGTGGINIDACRIGSETMVNKPAGNKPGGNSLNMSVIGMPQDAKETITQGRFPANIILDEEAGKMLDEQSGESKSQGGKNPINVDSKFGQVSNKDQFPFDYGDKGGASRFFYCAKASKSERNLGCEEMEDKTTDDGRGVVSDRPHQRGASSRKNNHPTVKPIKLMEYLIKLVTKEGTTVLDPFLGSGTTAIACEKLNRLWIGIEKEPEYIKIAEARIKHYSQQKKLIVNSPVVKE